MQPYSDISDLKVNVEEVVAGRNFLAAAEILRSDNIPPPRLLRHLNILSTFTYEVTSFSLLSSEC